MKKYERMTQFQVMTKEEYIKKCLERLRLLEDKIENGTLVEKTENDNVFIKLFEMLKQKMYVCPNFFEMRACSEKAWEECLHRSWSKYFNGKECVMEDYSKMFELWFQAEQKLKELKGEKV